MSTVSLRNNLDTNLNKATIVCEIPDIDDLRRRCTRKADYMRSEKFCIGRSSFGLEVCPNGGTKKDMMSVWLFNCSDHDVVVDFSSKAKGVPQDQRYGCKLEGGGGGVGLDMLVTKLEGSINLVAEVTLKSEAITREATDSDVSGAEGMTSGFNNVELELGSEGMLNQADIHLEERLEEVETESELEALSSQLMGMEAELHHLLNSDRSLIESKAKEMSEVLSELEEAEEEKAAIQKQIADVDARIGELQDRKKELEDLIEEKVRESKDARDQLEREIERVKNKLEGLSNVKTALVQPASLGEGDNLRLKWLESLESKIETEEKELECPVCLEVASFPIYSVHL